MLIVKFILTSLAVYRIAHMIVQEDGPFDVFHEMRAQMVKWTVERGREHWIVNGLHCIHCTGFWIALLFTLPLYIWVYGFPIWTNIWTNAIECAILWQALAATTFIWKKVTE